MRKTKFLANLLSGSACVGALPALALGGMFWLAEPMPAHAVESETDTGASSEGQCGDGEGDYSSLVKRFEGSDNPAAINPTSTATGSYQFLFGTLKELGYISAGSTPGAGEGDWAGSVWTGKDGVYSRAEFMANEAAQANALSEFTEKNLTAIAGTYEVGQVVNGIPMTDGGAAIASHMLGAGGFKQWAASGFAAEGLDAGIAAAHGWTQAEYRDHLMKRVAAGGCYDPADITGGSGSIGEMPLIGLMPWETGYPIAAIFPGAFATLRN